MRRVYLFEDFPRGGMRAPARALSAAQARDTYTPPQVEPANLAGAWSYEWISPYALANPGTHLPRDAWAAIAKHRGSEQITLGDDGQLYVMGAPIPFSTASAALNAMQPASPPASGPYGDAVELPFVLAAGTGVRALGRATGKRVMLQIQNLGLVNKASYNFGAPANNQSLLIAEGGSTSYLNAVPQNELWLFSTLGTTLVVAYIDVPTGIA